MSDGDFCIVYIHSKLVDHHHHPRTFYTRNILGIFSALQYNMATLYGTDPKIWETTIVRTDLKVSGNLAFSSYLPTKYRSLLTG